MTSITIELDPEISRKLAELADGARRSASNLAADAVAFYVETELDVRAAILEGLDDLAAGHVVPHAEAMAEVDNLLAEIERRTV